MRIAIVSHDTFWPLRGGGGIRVYWVAKAFIQRYHYVSILAPFLDYQGIEKEFSHIHIFSLGKISRFVPLKEIVYGYLMLQIFLRLLFRKFDVIYAHNVVACFPSLLVGKIKGIPVIFDMDDLLTGYSRNPLVYRFGSLLEKFVAKRVSKTIVSSRYVQQWCEEKGITDTVIVRHGVDLLLFTPKKKPKKYITLTGGIEVNDGVLLIPPAAKKVLKIFPDVVFLFVGEGKDAFRLEQLVDSMGLSSHFIFRGWMPHSEIPDVLAQSKIGLVTSLKVSATEFSSPLRSYEYMAMELPFVAPDLCGIVEQVEESGAGIIFKNGNSDDLARAILQLLQNETLSRTMGRKGRRYVVKYCNWRNNAKKMCGIVEKAVA